MSKIKKPGWISELRRSLVADFSRLFACLTSSYELYRETEPDMAGVTQLDLNISPLQLARITIDYEALMKSGLKAVVFTSASKLSPNTPSYPFAAR